MLRVSWTHEDERQTRLSVEGRLAEQWIDELHRAVCELLDASRTLTMDLSGLTFADAEGAALLRHLEQRGVRLVGGSAFVTLLIAEGSR